MCVRHRNPIWTLSLLLLSGAFCSEWKVEYPEQPICAVKGSSVFVPCSFFYPSRLKVNRIMWGRERFNIYDGPFILDSEALNSSSRLQYMGDKHRNCSLKIHQVEHNDAGIYAFRFVTNEKKGEFTGAKGLQLKIVDLLAKSNGNKPTKEGDAVNLTCINSCDGDHLSSTFSWFKDGELINEGPELTLSNVSSTNSGNYTCSLKTHTGTTSEVINIDVEYGPKNTSVFVRPSMEVEVGSNATLICSSRGNPPVENYTWFKKNDDDDDDDDDDVGHQRVFFSGDGGQYFCRATNKHGSQNSSVVSVTIKQCLPTVNRNVPIVVTVVVLLIVTTVAAVWRLNKKRAAVVDCEENTQTADGTYVNFPFSGNNQSQEGNQCEGATSELIYATIDFNTKGKSNMEQEMDSNHDDEDVTYGAVWRN